MSPYRHNHVVPRSHVGMFASDGLVDCHFVRDGSRRRLSPSSVAVRKNIYSERLPDGTVSTAFEQAIGPLEQQAVEAMRRIEGGAWPVGAEDRAVLAEYLALQAVRVPAYRQFFDRVRAESLDERARGLSTSQREQLRRFSESDGFRLDMMLTQLAKLGTVIGSMYWALVKFPSPRLLCSDHPLAAIPLTPTGVASASAVPPHGFMNTVEFHFPMSSRTALLLSWRDVPDDQPVITGKAHHIKTINAGVRAQAEEHWFHRPGTPTPCGSGVLVPVSYEVFGDYDTNAVLASQRRREVDSAVTELIDTEEVGKMRLIQLSGRS